MKINRIPNNNMQLDALLGLLEKRKRISVENWINI
jgi:hypothetical protein